MILIRTFSLHHLHFSSRNSQWAVQKEGSIIIIFERTLAKSYLLKNGSKFVNLRFYTWLHYSSRNGHSAVQKRIKDKKVRVSNLEDFCTILLNITIKIFVIKATWPAIKELKWFILSRIWKLMFTNLHKHLSFFFFS